MMLGVIDRRGEPRLALEALAVRRFIHELGRDRLDRDRATER